jgi:2-keto-4-pentenoate hydratase/2-oxohepta-3-ene-1,7-dioic acid hydratase in catechol pathway
MAGQKLHESFDHFPTAYNGRASSLLVGGTPIRRPRGMIRKTGQAGYEFAPSSRLDFELEMGIIISKTIPRGITVMANEATWAFQWQSNGNQYQSLGNHARGTDGLTNYYIERPS